jgi:hypothetical protein
MKRPVKTPTIQLVILFALFNFLVMDSFSLQSAKERNRGRNLSFNEQESTGFTQSFEKLFELKEIISLSDRVIVGAIDVLDISSNGNFLV